MQIDVTQPILDYENKPVFSNDKSTGTQKVLDFRQVVMNALNQIEATTTPEEKVEAFRLSVLVYGTEKAEFTIEDLALIKKRVGKIYSALVYGRVLEIIENKKKPN